MGGGSTDGWDWDEHGSWRKPDPPACNAFHPYTSNPLLCKCGRPVTEHTSFMQRMNEKQESEQARRDRIKESVLEVLGTELIPDPDDELVEVTPTLRVAKRDLKILREYFQNEKEEPPNKPDRKMCKHLYPDGRSAWESGFFGGSCTICGENDL